MAKPINSFFDILKCVLGKTEYPTEEEINKHFNSWMIFNYLSCSEPLTELAHELSKLKLSNKEYFDICYFGIPKTKTFIQYNAKKTKKEENIKYLMDYYKCSQQTAKEYHALISEKEMDTITEYFKNRGLKK